MNICKYAKSVPITQLSQILWSHFFKFFHGLLLHFLIVFLPEISSLNTSYKMTNPTQLLYQNSLFSLIHFIGTYTSYYYMENHILKTYSYIYSKL